MSLRANLFQVVAFAADPLHGNSAFALTGVGEATERQLTTVCAMLRTDIIAVVGDGTDDAHPLDSSPQLVPTTGQFNSCPHNEADGVPFSLGEGFAGRPWLLPGPPDEGQCCVTDFSQGLRRGS
jgi:hypothetical protein